MVKSASATPRGERDVLFGAVFGHFRAGDALRGEAVAQHGEVVQSDRHLDRVAAVGVDTRHWSP